MEKIQKFVNDNLTFIILGVVLVVIVTIVIILKSRKNKYKRYTATITELDRDKVRVIHTPIDHELAKLNKVIKNVDLLVLLGEWHSRWDELKKVRVREITNAILSVEDNVERGRFKGVEADLDKCKELIEKLRSDAKKLYDEIYAVSKLEDTIRDKFTKLKIKFRKVKKLFLDNEPVLIYMKAELDQKVEDITDHIAQLEHVISVNEYEQAEKMIEDITKEIEAFELLIENLPDLLIVVKQFIPRKIVDLENNYDNYKKKEVPLKHLRFEDSIREVREMSEEILNKMKKLTFSDIEAQISGIIEFCDGVKTIVDNEVNNYYVFRDNYEDLSQTVEDITLYTQNLKDEIEKVKVLYEISDFDESDYLKFETEIIAINNRFQNLKIIPREGDFYYDLNESVVAILEDAKATIDNVKDGTDRVLSLRADEQRAREQIVEIQYLVDTSKEIMRNANIPVVPGEFRTYVADAKDGIKYIIDELEKTPICVDTLNKRVDTSLELAYKLYNNTKRIIKEAMLAESAMLYGNRYRSSFENVDREISKAEKLYFDGKYHNCLNTTVNILEKTEPGIYEQIKAYFEKAKGGYERETSVPR